MNALEFLRVARALNGSAQEAEWRTSIGRSYYALFLHLRLRLEPIKPFPKDDEDHQRVVHYLTNANDRNLQSVGQTVKDLRTSRNEADYDMDAAVAQTQSQLTLTIAAKAIEKLGAVTPAALKALIGAIPTYRSRRQSGNP